MFCDDKNIFRRDLLPGFECRVLDTKFSRYISQGNRPQFLPNCYFRIAYHNPAAEILNKGSPDEFM